jgi:serine/threonine protein kinase
MPAEFLSTFLSTIKMPDKIGRFELVSQLAQSPVATIYKALDSDNQQTVALKVVPLNAVKDGAALLKNVLEEADQAKPLSSHNIAVLYGVGEEDSQLLAATEYVQGNSIATTLSRHEGFSIWDLQDITRQVCHALDHAQVHKVGHQSLEPAKIMVQWDGQVKMLGFGISAMSAHAAEISGAVPEVLHYASPEQLRGEACDHRSVLFSLGAVLYEMATEQKAFPGKTAEQVRQAILENQPPLPVRLKPNVNQGLSKLIMKALSKSPDERYQTGQELVQDLEQCKGSANTLAGATVPAPQKPAPQKPKVQAAAAGAAATSSRVGSTAPGTPGLTSIGLSSTQNPPSTTASLPKMTASSAAVEEPKSSFAVDPMMAEDDDSPAAAVRRSFSDMSEMPPLKEVYVAPPPPPPAADEPVAAEPLPQVVLKKKPPEKPSVQVREVAQKAATAIRRTPPKLYLYAMVGAALIIALIVGVMALMNYWQDRDNASSAAPATAVTQPAPVQNVLPPAQRPAPEPQPQSDTASPQDSQPQTAETASPEPDVRNSRGQKTKSRAMVAPVLAQLTVSSNPAGAQITFDGSSLCTTPCTLTGIAPGQHAVSASKSGYGSATQNVVLGSGTNSSISIDLSPASAKLAVSSSPAGAVILIDGQDTGKLSPSQFVLNKPGTHTIVVRRSGYLDETSTVTTESGQIASVNLVLKPLGNTDEIRAAGGHFKKVFGGGDTAGMGIVSIKTQPKGAQIMVNNRVLDKTSPFDFYLNPGTYVIDITMSGYHSLHRVIVVGEREKVAIEEALSSE